MPSSDIAGRSSHRSFSDAGSGRDAVRVVAVDLGATSGRVMVARVGRDPDVLDLAEVHRFTNGAVRLDDGSLRWDVERIHEEMLTGIRSAASGGAVDAIGIDSWGVDYGLLDEDGLLVGSPYSHRDGRTDGVPEQVAAEISDAELYDLTGVQRLPINTIYQLASARGSAELASARTLLLLPDLLGYWLTGERGAERTNASTTQLYGARSHAWLPELLDRLGLPSSILPPLRSPGDVVGILLPEVTAGLGITGKIPVIAVGSHDTASAVVGVPAGDEPFAYISSGTWSLVGLELTGPILTDEARAAGFTNESGVDGSTRFLRNVMGLWVISECLREWAADDRPDAARPDLAGLLGAADTLPRLGCVVDIDDPRLLPPGDMPRRIRELADLAGEPVPSSPPAVIRCVLDSLALAYRRTVREAARIGGIAPEVVHVVGGGSQNAILCQLTADACGLPVLAGPQEAAALGNVLVQARSLGVEIPTLPAMRSLLRGTHSVRRFEPRAITGGDDPWEAAEIRLRSSGA